ncbi:DUF4253 domain-containing protein [Rubinisphaera brasiliensis]|uniref:DUF4253 domain-containing protein n=1 Tax=Rubinisphaera brasiliensis (strain ATCC 49424 / DSM 5305 / JCM 21570 / IAM 15109 / NBRC 103401 / IFAM 1448) TaxID=756272 RepID=F0SGS6_RUBBR|nr:DUF4253 domain-containing protein [Rubinisphaera brasiliensis]ADY58361.1 hypothetical protein Plabr_0734 [Rubinisphaera brasiliensis DSM 5305]
MENLPSRPGDCNRYPGKTIVVHHPITLIACLMLVASIGCSPNNGSTSPDGSLPETENGPIVTLDAAAQRLAEMSGASIRDYSTYDFGRNRDQNAKSVVASHDRSPQLVAEMREHLGQNLICFVGTTRWLGDEEHDGDEIVVANGNSQFDILRIARSDAINYGMETDDLIKKLRVYDDEFGIDIFHAETDTIEFAFQKMPEDLAAFCKDLYEFCPDIVDQGTGTVELLEKEIREREQVFLWWD